MTHKKTSVQNRADMPSVQITSNRNRLKVYDKKSKLPKIYLKGNSHFEFEFFNPTQERIGITIYLNGKCINTGHMLIIRPGDHGFLERYLTDGDARKFLFDTYVVNDGNEQVKKAIEKNGHVKIEFYKEQPEMIFNNVYNYKQFNNPYNKIVYGDGINDGTSINTRSNFSTTIGDTNIGDTLDFFDTSYETKSANTNLSKQVKSSKRSTKRHLSKKIETGRIEKGASSDQTFEYTTFNPQAFSFHTVEMKLLPESTKSIDIKTQTKLYCPNCRYRIRDRNWKWCPKCSADLRNI